MSKTIEKYFDDFQDNCKWETKTHKGGYSITLPKPVDQKCSVCLQMISKTPSPITYKCDNKYYCGNCFNEVKPFKV